MGIEEIRAGAEADTSDVFTEPWQSRAVALAIETVHGLGLTWDDFRARLITAIEDEPHRPYYESWLAALESVTTSEGAAALDELETQRMAAASYRIDEAGHDDLEVFPMAVGDARLLDGLTLIFGQWWPQIRFGTLIEGAVYELRASRQPTLSMLDGYLTLDFGDWHAHLCIGEHKGVPGRGVDPALARRRRCAHAELQRQWIDGAPRTWMFRMFNGDGAQQLTVLLPNPFLDDDQHPLAQPDWSRLALWDDLRARFLALPPDPLDRTGSGFVHA